MKIVPLPRFEAEADPVARGLSEEDLAAYSALQAPKSVVVRFGEMGMVGEFPANLDRVPGCGTKFVVRTHRGTEIGEMLTTTCENSGCGKSISRREMLEYIENSGGKNYPFFTNGEVLRIATLEDLQHMEKLRDLKRRMLDHARQVVAGLGVDMKVVSVEPILGEEILTIFYLAEQRVDFATIVPALARELLCRVEMRQIGLREEARLTADYERCGQHCCCKQFLKVLKPISMKSAKMQKGTLDPMKISGRCGRLMCCLRYEDVTYQQLKKNLPHRRSRVGTPDGPGLVVSTQILTQLVLVELESDRTRIAVPVESLCHPDECPDPSTQVEEDPMRGMQEEQVAKRSGRSDRDRERRQDRHRQASKEQVAEEPAAASEPSGDVTAPEKEQPRKKRRRRGRRRKQGGGEAKGSQGRGEQAGPATQDEASSAGTDAQGSGEGDGGGGGGPKPKRGRRRRRRGRRGGSKPSGGEGSGGASPDGE